MLVVGITGPVGSGKTSLLVSLAAWFQQQHKSVDGFFALGENRKSQNLGAEKYELQMIASGEILPYAFRDESKTPPYIFNNETETHLCEWAEQIKLSGAPALIVLDEFGPREASGKGHAQLWESIKSSNPALVVIAVRSEIIPEIEQVLKMSFDICVEVQNSDAWTKLRAICAEHDDWKRVCVYGAASGGFEASVGAMLHTMQVPFRGIGLSSVQSMVMTYAGDGLGTRGRVVWIPFISAGIKALSPSGDRLVPMLAISMQGILYTLATQLLGWNFLGVAVGGFLVGAWAAAQGVILQILFVGKDVFRVYDFILQWLADKLHLPPFGLIGLMLIWSSIAGIVSASLTVYSYRRRHRIPEKLQSLILKGAPIFASEETKLTWHATIKNSLRDLARPYFWLPIGIIMVLVLVSGSSIENVFWIAVRASTVAVVVFSLVRSFEPRAFLTWLRKRGYWGPAYAFRFVFLPSSKSNNQK
jgi:nucleoside-triphosphatase THEP1